MKIAEILELTKSEPLAAIAKNRLGIGKEKARDAIKKAGCYSKNGVKGWFFDGDKSVLDQSIYDFVESKISRKPSPNVSTKEHSNRTNQRSKVSAKEEIEQANEQTAPTKEPMKERTNKGINVTTNIIRKRSSFDLDVELMKELKIQAIVHDRPMFEIVESAIRQYLNELKKN